jgi:hypothetical protein
VSLPTIRRPQGLLGLTGLFGLLLVVGYVLKTILLVVDPDRNATFAAYAQYRITPVTVLLIALGLGGFAIGLLVRLPPRAVARSDARIPTWVGVAGLGAGASSFMVLVVAAGLGLGALRPFQSATRGALLDQYVGRGLMGLAISVMPLFLLLLPTTRDARWVRRLGLLLVLLILAIVGSRLLLLGTILSVGVFHLRRSGRQVSLFRQLVVAGAIAVAGAALGAVLFSGQEQVAEPYDLVVRLMATFDMPDTLAVVETTPERFGGLTVIEDAVITYAPRSVWQDKPYFYGGYRLQEAAFPGIGEEYQLGAFFPVGLFGESFLNFGILGVALIPFLLAIALRLVDRWSTYSMDRLAVACFAYGQLLGLLRSPGQFIAYVVVVVVLWRLARLAARPESHFRPPPPTAAAVGVPAGLTAGSATAL